MSALLANSSSLSKVERRRWSVHVALLVSLAGSLVSLIYLSHSITSHVIFGVMFIFFMLIHLCQRRRTIASLIKRMAGFLPRTGSTTRLGISDAIFELLALNVLVSGTVEIFNHQATRFPLGATLHLPPGLDQWHKLVAIVFVVYAVVHITRRRKRLRRSHIR
jgi:hypothetical protein